MKKIISLGLAVLSTACASLYESNVATPAAYHKPELIDQNYTISGRFSIKTTAKNYYGNFTWLKESANEELDFMSPLGSTVAQIRIESAIVTLTDAQNKVYSGEDVAALMVQRLGFTIPLSYLHYWIQGIPLPNYPVQSQLKSGFSQLDWQVEYLSWQDHDHPQLIQLTKNDLRIKLLINW